MKPQTEGAWIIHHTKKLQLVSGTNSFDDINSAGKCGILLSALAASDSTSLIDEKTVKAIAKASKISSLELPSILDTLQKQYLIDKSSKQDVSVIGLTTASVLNHTVDIFKSVEPTKFEKSAIELSEAVSSEPIRQDLLKEKISDENKLSTVEVEELFEQSEQIGFIDSETFGNSRDKLYFNGNLFRTEHIKKAEKVLSTLSPAERQQFITLDNVLSEKGCITLTDAGKICSLELIQKLISISMIDHSTVANDLDNQSFITKPSAFSKFGSPFEEDALDLAKSFVASLTYGMVFSQHNRGRIYDLSALLNKLIRGEEVGPTTSIGQDYKVLEFNRVIKLRPDSRYPNRFWMKLLKKDVGQLALKVLQTGDAASEEGVLDFASSSITQYTGPEFNRDQLRRKTIVKETKTQIYEALSSLRLSN